MLRSAGSLSLLCGLLLLALPNAMHAQTAASGAADAPGSAAAFTPSMTFDVASVRENKEADLHRGITMSGNFTPHTTHLRLTNWTIENILTMAYGVDQYQIDGSPHWPFPTVFVIEAKGDSDEDAKMAALTPKQQMEEQEHMLQALLADRFQLKAHWETREGAIFNLVVAKGGPKLHSRGLLFELGGEVFPLGGEGGAQAAEVFELRCGALRFLGGDEVAELIFDRGDALVDGGKLALDEGHAVFELLQLDGVEALDGRLWRNGSGG